jgi:hypothetical protein
LPRLREASDRQLRALLILLTLAVRAPYWRTFDLVTFDGAFYVNQAKALLHGSLGGGVFSIGYPLAIAPVMLIVRDGVLAARLVSLLAAVGSVLLLNELCRKHVGRVYAALGAACLSVTPLFILTSLLSNAESALVFWLLLGVVLCEKWRPARSGIAMGMAAAHAARSPRWQERRNSRLRCRAAWRPSRWRASPCARSTWSRFRWSAVPSPARAVPIAPRTHRGKRWRNDSRDRCGGDAGECYGSRQQLRDSNAAHTASLGRQLLPLIPFDWWAWCGSPISCPPCWHRPLLPLFLQRDQTRVALLAPYLPPLIYYAMVALDVRRPRAPVLPPRWSCLDGRVLLDQSIVAEARAEGDFATTRDAARRFASNVHPGDLMADRKPYFALYSGARYVEIPMATYDDTIDHLAQANVRYLSLHPKTVILRPALLQLVYDASAVRGELRYRQVLVEDTGEIVMERVRVDEPLVLQPITDTKAVDFAPAWSPDGTRIAFRRSTSDGESSIWVVDERNNARELEKPTRAGRVS